MAIEKNKVASKIKLGTEQINVECNVQIEEEISKLLSYTSHPKIDNISVSSGEVNINGKLIAKLIYLSLDNQIQCKEHVCEFSSKYTNSNLQSDINVDVLVKNVDVNASISQDNTVKISSVLELCYIACVEEDVNMLVSATDDICIKTSECNLISLVANDCQVFEENLTIQIKEKFERLICVDTEVMVKEYVPGSNFISVSGDILTRIMYLSDAETGKIITSSVAEPFKQEIEASGVSLSSSLEVFAKVQKEALKTEVNTDNGTYLTISTPIKVCYKAYEERVVPCSIDLYSTQNSVETVTSSFNKLKLSSIEHLESKIEGGLTLAETEARVDKILAITSPYLISTNSYVKDGEVCLEGVAFANVVYLNDETMSINSIQIEVPYAISEKTQLDSDAEILVDEILDDVDVIVKKGRELYFDAKIKATINAFSTQTDAVISDITIGEKLPEKDCAIEIYFGKEGDELWDIAKSLNISVENLKMQNPDVKDILESNINLTIFYQKNR